MLSNKSGVFNAFSRLASEFIFDIKSVDEFREKVVDSGDNVVVDFHAHWCSPCRALGPRLEKEVEKRNGKVKLAKIDVDDPNVRDIAVEHQVSGIPAVFAYKNGEPVDGFVGLIQKSQIRAFIDELEKD